MKLAIVTSHPIQYNAPLFRELARRIELHVFYMHRVTPDDQARAGFGVGFAWDVDLLSGYRSSFLDNVSKHPGLRTFNGVDVPGVGTALASVTMRCGSSHRLEPEGLPAIHLGCKAVGIAAARTRG